ncbi:sulfite exporter TauE/SafE family protein [Streptantibioticus ferralitis]|uniref:Probable membrane transporter protein n=1 Tax=Streptantibioticus ferralitis TaxID=236510 RepID=A0ABT5YUS7_9ACTN|nr:sulfite exporter TauE/SafE family protein [Streptantibioticus ferralitis]MDF2255340.1 sulfite exporter TauE/SafE family protein [Streptantibioticus ferralitis]
MTLLGMALGGLIGLCLGALGGGGSILTVPVLVYALGQSAQSATTGGLVVVGLTAVCSTWSHARAGNVRWGAGAAFGASGIAASYGGTALNRLVNPTVLMLCFAALMVVSAVAMFRRGRTSAPVPERTRKTPVARILASGLAVGFLTGFLGVGGGFVIVPALVGALGYEMPVAVGTSLLVIAINSAVALAARAGEETLHWAVIAPLTAAAVIGSLLGRRASARVPSATLTRAFATLTVAVAGYLAVRCAVG